MSLHQTGDRSEQPFQKAKKRAVVDRGDGFIVIRLPWLVPASVRDHIAQDVLSDMRVQYPDLVFKASVGSRLVRFTWKPRHHPPGSLPKLPQRAFNLENDR